MPNPSAPPRYLRTYFHSFRRQDRFGRYRCRRVPELYTLQRLEATRELSLLFCAVEFRKESQGR
jgi:hypothetical protein